MIRFLLFIALCAIIGKSHGDVPGHVQYLIKYGYLESLEEGGPPNSFTDEEIDSALKTAQKFAGIPETGKLDNATIKMLTAPRCAFPDKGSRVERFGIHSKWNKIDLKYRFTNFNCNLEPEQIKDTIAKALSTWAKPTTLKFTLVDKRPSDLIIGFFTGNHGHGAKNTLGGKVLAHAAFPSFGDVCFDSSTKWYIDKPPAGSYSLLPTATHELGHALGLEHSNAPGAIMRPQYTSQTDLGEDDIKGIQAMYGKK